MQKNYRFDNGSGVSNYTEDDRTITGAESYQSMDLTSASDVLIRSQLGPREGLKVSNW